MSETRKHRFVRTLREIADYVESRPFDEDLPFEVPLFSLYLRDKKQFGEAVAAAGNVEKCVSGMEYLHAKVSFREHYFIIAIEQDLVCHRVKVGEKTIPATEEHTVPAESERVEDVYKYECPDSFLSLKDEPVAAAAASESEVPA